MCASIYGKQRLRCIAPCGALCVHTPAPTCGYPGGTASLSHSLMALPLYCVGETVHCRSHYLGSWRARILSKALASEMPTLSYSQGWCYEVLLPQRRGGLACGTVWLAEESLAGWDEIGYP